MTTPLPLSASAPRPGRVFVPTASDFPRTADAVVIGGGILGVASAFWLSRAGLDTVLLEKRDGLSTLTTAASAESVRSQFTTSVLLDLAAPSCEIWEHFSDVVGVPGCDISFRQRGYLFMTEREETVDDLRKIVQKHHELGVTDSQFLTGDEVRRRFPFVSPHALAASFRQRDGWLSTHEATQGFAKGSGARFLVGTPAIGILRDAAGIAGVETRLGTISTRVLVNAAGPFSAVVGRMAGIELPIQTVRRQKVFIAAPGVPDYAPVTIDVDTDASWRPEAGGALLNWPDPDEPATAPTENVPTDWRFAAVALERIIPLSPFFEGIAETLTRDQVRISAGQYTYTPDQKGLLGPVPEVPGLYLNCGFVAGVLAAPAAGLRLADLVTGKMKPQDNPLRPTRYAEGLYHPCGNLLTGE